jgi:phosphopantothenoylcysteine decarboxylase/phosphopantothenate--cysteine ligase
VIVPASADLLAKMAHGFGDEALTATLLSYEGPLVIAPAMESRMWRHPATQANVAVLQKRGARFVGPVEGALASGRSGAGRMAPVADVVEAVVQALSPRDLAKRTVLITAGPTVEDIDPVRFISNRSSGRMGAALARAAARRGATVELVHGPMRAQVPSTPGVRAHAVRSAREMNERVQALIARADVAIMSAAVADLRPRSAADRKLKKGEDALSTLALVENPDILASLGQARVKQRGGGKRPVLVGFAAETHDVEKYAAAKLARKKCDLIVANDVAEAGSGFDVDTNRVYLARAGGSRWLERASKDAVADRVLDEVVALLAAAAKAARPSRKAGARRRS